MQLLLHTKNNAFGVYKAVVHLYDVNMDLVAKESLLTMFLNPYKKKLVYKEDEPNLFIDCLCAR